MAGLRRVEIDTTKLLQVENVDDAGTIDVEDALVKVCPTLAATERLGWDGEGIRTKLLERGAAGVILAPRFVPTAVEEQPAEDRNRPLTPREAAAAWMQMVKADAAVKARALEHLERAMSAEGM